MAYIYEVIEEENGKQVITATDPETNQVLSFLNDPANSDYQAYLTKDEVKADEAKAK